MRAVIATAARVQLNACACLQLFLNRLSEARPCMPTAHSAEIFDWLRGWAQEPLAITYYRFEGQHPPSWIETFHIHRTLWHLELIQRVQKLARSRRSRSRIELDEFLGFYAEWNWIRRRFQEIHTITECIEEMAVTKLEPIGTRYPYFFTVPLPSELSVQVCWALPEIPTYHDVWKLVPWCQDVSATCVEDS